MSGVSEEFYATVLRHKAADVGRQSAARIEEDSARSELKQVLAPERSAADRVASLLFLALVLRHRPRSVGHRHQVILGGRRGNDGRRWGGRRHHRRRRWGRCRRRGRCWLRLHGRQSVTSVSRDRRRFIDWYVRQRQCRPGQQHGSGKQPIHVAHPLRESKIVREQDRECSGTRCKVCTENAEFAAATRQDGRIAEDEDSRFLPVYEQTSTDSAAQPPHALQ